MEIVSNIFEPRDALENSSWGTKGTVNWESWGTFFW